MPYLRSRFILWVLEQIHVEHYKNIVINNNSVLKSQTKHTDTHIEVSTKKNVWRQVIDVLVNVTDKVATNQNRLNPFNYLGT